MLLSQCRPLGLSQSRPTGFPGGRTSPGLVLSSPAWRPVLQGRRQVATILQAAKVEEAPAKAAPQVASAKADAPAAKATAPALTPQDLDRVILMQGEHLVHAGPAYWQSTALFALSMAKGSPCLCSYSSISRLLPQAFGGRVR